MKVEIAHDILAKKVYARIDAEDKMRLKVGQFVRDRYEYFLEENVLLGQKDLNYIDPYLDDIELTNAQLEFIAVCRKEVGRKSRQKNLIIGSVIFLLTALSAMAIWQAKVATHQAVIADEATKATQNALKEVENKKKDAELQEKIAIAAKDSAEILRQIAEENLVIATLREKEAIHQKSLADKAKEEAIISGDSTRLALNLLAKSQESEELAKQETRKSKDSLETVSSSFVMNLIDEVDEHISRLEYSAAVEKLNQMINLEQDQSEVSKRLMEVAYFSVESGKSAEAVKMIDQIISLLGTEFSELSQKMNARSGNMSPKEIGSMLEEIDPTHMAFLRARYYPQVLDIPAGKYKIGCLGQDCSRESYPTVDLGSFQIAKQMTTTWQFGLFCAAKGRDIKDYFPSQKEINGNQAIMYVSWNEAVEYANWVNEQDGIKSFYIVGKPIGEHNKEILLEPAHLADAWRLPTEAEWEFVARGANERVLQADQASIDLAKSLGVLDFSKDKNEWCHDWYGNSWPSGIDPLGPQVGVYRLVRGNTLLERKYDIPYYSFKNCGFRLARTR